MDSEQPQGNLANKKEMSPSVAAKENGNSPKNEQKVKKRSRRRRSRSQTPQPTKTGDSQTLVITLMKLQEEEEAPKETTQENGVSKKNGTKESKPEAEVVVVDDEVEVMEVKKVEAVENKVVDDKEKEAAEKAASPKKANPAVSPQGSVEMEPLVLSDEPEQELQFDEISEPESGKGSPIISRCNTRRSQTRNIPTPKTPKQAESDQEVENSNSETTKAEASSVDVTCSSTKAEAGGDSTRLDYNSTPEEDSSYLNEARERSLTETLRGLSSRRPIREDYRRRAYQNAQDRSELNMQRLDSIETVQTGVKRKNRSVTPEETKKFKGDASGLFSSPFAGFKSKFKAEVASSTPKLLGYKDNRGMQLEEGIATDHRNAGEEKSWCVVM